MKHYKITGGNKLSGEVNISGSKNAALPILAATLMSKEAIQLSNVPEIADITSLLDCLSTLGKKVEKRDGDTVLIASEKCQTWVIPKEAAKNIRASILLLGPLLTQVETLILPLPGGCNIGKRPIDQHIMAMRAFGVEIIEHEDHLECKRQGSRLKAAAIHFSVKTVTGTENAIMAAVLAEGVSQISNIAREPEVDDLVDFLNGLGAQIVRNSDDSLTITGVRELRQKAPYHIIGDRIEAGTFLIAAAITGGSVQVNGVSPEHLTAVLEVLEQTGVTIQCKDKCIYLEMNQKDKRPFTVETQPYPGFPTDLQSIFLSFATQLHGCSLIKETLFENRFQIAAQLAKMGAKIDIETETALIHGSTELQGASVLAGDLRSGAALICATLAAKGESCVYGISHIERGYEQLVEKLRALGANIVEVKSESLQSRLGLFSVQDSNDSDSVAVMQP